MESLKRYCFALDLVDDPKLIAEYKKYHEKIWPEITANIKNSGIVDMQIYCLGNRLFMIMDVNHSFTFEKKATLDAASTIEKDWQELMWKYQKALPMAKPGEKWLLMEKIYQLEP